MLKALLETADVLFSHSSAKHALGSPDFADKQYASKPFSASNFRTIEASDPDKTVSVSKIAFVDAGNLELIGSSSFSVHLIRGYFSIFRQNRRVSSRNIPQKVEFFSVATAKESKGGIAYECTLVPISDAAQNFLPQKRIVFDSFDETLSARKNFRANISVIGAAVRRYLEWSIASEVISKELGAGDILLRDGTLESSVSGEEKYSKKAFDLANEKGIFLCALAKASALLTTTGFPLCYAVDSLAESAKLAAPWVYSSLCENKNPLHTAEIFVAKLHKDSVRSFRFELDKNSAPPRENINRVLSAIAANSCDASFFGYPYGLIDADAMSRISFREAGNYRAMLSSVLEKRGAMASIQKLSGSIDAHDVLNDIII